MSNKYEIRTVEDFLAVPQDKLSECLRDFKQWVELAYELNALFGEGAMVKTEFIWFDDGIEGISSIKIVDGAAI
jgi:hypothetical protein